MKHVLIWIVSRLRVTRLAVLLFWFSLGVVIEHLGALLKEWAGAEVKALWEVPEEEEEEVEE